MTNFAEKYSAEVEAHKKTLLRLKRAEAVGKELIEIGNKLHFQVRNLDFAMWEEDHNPDVERYVIPEYIADVLKSWSDKALSQNQKGEG